MEKEEVKLFGIWSSPYVLRVKWALRMKGVEYEYIEEDLSNKSPLLLQYNPVHKKVPVLVHNGKPICESLVILEYIDDTWRNDQILPKDPYGRAMARFWSKFGADKLSLSMRHVFMTQGKEQEEAHGSAIENLKILEEELKGKKFFNGEKIGFTDISLGWLANLGTHEEVAKLKLIDGERFPSLFAWIKAFANSPIIKDSFPPEEKMLPKLHKLREAFLESKGKI